MSNLSENATRDHAAEATDVPSLNEALGILQDELIRFKGTLEHIEQSKEAAREAANSAVQIGEATARLIEPMNALIQRLDNVDFLSRLDKIDSTVSAVHTGFQFIQGRLDSTERNLKDDLRRIEDATENRLTTGFQKVQESLELSEEKSKEDILALQTNIGQVRDVMEEKTQTIEEVVTQHALHQLKILSQHRWLHIGTIVGLVLLAVLNLLLL